MKSLAFTIGAVIALGACAASSQPTAWGKAGVSRIDYGTDLGVCTGRASEQGAGNGANTAGGVSGSNSAPAMGSAGRGTQRGANGAAPSQTAAARSSDLPVQGTYSGTATSDYAQRAATQQRAQEMNAKRLRAEAYKVCLTGKGYREFTLTPEQGAHLATLKESGARLEYLYRLGSALAPAAPPGS